MPWLASSATQESSSATSRCCPLPVTARLATAAQIAIVAYMPVKMSITGTPTRIGPAPGAPSGSPVRLIRPAMPCAMKS